MIDFWKSSCNERFRDRAWRRWRCGYKIASQNRARTPPARPCTQKTSSPRPVVAVQVAGRGEDIPVVAHTT
jgi:hypothetical protein